jgi:GT2 family glycosyltransferase
MLAGVSSDLGIAVITYRTPQLALDCLQRLRQAAPAASIVLVDTAPDAAFQQRLAAEQPAVRYLAAPNHSYARSVNLGLAALQTGQLLLMNADVLVEADTLGRLQDALGRTPRGGVVGPLALTPAGEPQPLGLPYQRFYRRLFAARRSAPAGRAAAVPVTWLSGCMQLLDRAAWQASGGYDEAFRFFNEDMDFCLRLTTAGYACQLVDAPVVHLGGASTPSHPAFHVEGRRGGVLLARRHHSRPFRAAQMAFLWTEALVGALLAGTAQQRQGHRWMLRLLRSGAWNQSPFGATLDVRPRPNFP